MENVVTYGKQEKVQKKLFEILPTLCSTESFVREYFVFLQNGSENEKHILGLQDPQLPTIFQSIVENLQREISLLDPEKHQLVLTGSSAPFIVHLLELNRIHFPYIRLGYRLNKHTYGHNSTIRGFQIGGDMGTYYFPNHIIASGKEIVIVDDFIDTGIKSSWIDIHLKSLGSIPKFIYLTAAPKYVNHDANTPTYTYNFTDALDIAKPQYHSHGSPDISIMTPNIFSMAQQYNSYKVIYSIANIYSKSISEILHFFPHNDSYGVDMNIKFNSTDWFSNLFKETYKIINFLNRNE